VNSVTITGVLFDYSGTLFHLRAHEHWLAGLHGEDGEELDLEARVGLMQRMTATAGPSAALSPEWLRRWHRRDLDPETHRSVYLEVLRLSGLSTGIAEQLYARLISAEYWEPYPDTAEALKRLREAGVPVAVVSNIAWDIRQVFARYDVEGLVDTFVMSYVEGVVKPEPRIFTEACERIGVRPGEVLMIGDSEEADGGAAALGAEVAIVESLPVDQRPHALLDALTAYQVL
jgi:HAD superfamily hydrolase (TIGR01493 family)